MRSVYVIYKKNLIPKINITVSLFGACNIYHAHITHVSLFFEEEKSFLGLA